MTESVETMAGELLKTESADVVIEGVTERIHRILKFTCALCSVPLRWTRDGHVGLSLSQDNRHDLQDCKRRLKQHIDHQCLPPWVGDGKRRDDRRLESAP